MRLRVIAPARLHFGLLQIDPRLPHCFGGIGLMLNEPELIVSGTFTEDSRDPVLFSESVAESSRMELAAKVQIAATQAINVICPKLTRNIQFRIEASPRLHTGLGTGTQLACCVATLVQALNCSQHHTRELVRGAATIASLPICELWSTDKDSPDTPHHRLAHASGRGKRSHIGLEGFLSGGWIYDHGDCSYHIKQAAEPNLTRVERLDFPSQWRVLLFMNNLDEGLSGEREQASFELSQHRENHVSAQMIDLATKSILPAIREVDFLAFAKAIRSYNQMAGKLFLSSNPNPVTAAAMSKLATVLERFGIEAYGQSSWGPTMWAVLPNDHQFTELQDPLRSALHDAELDQIKIRSVGVCATGAFLQQAQ